MIHKNEAKNQTQSSEEEGERNWVTQIGQYTLTCSLIGVVTHLGVDNKTILELQYEYHNHGPTPKAVKRRKVRGIGLHKLVNEP